MEIIESKNLTYKYKFFNEDGNEDELTALNSINIKINEGDFVSILGHNGSGKSTFAKQINGLLVPTEGTIFVHNLDTSKEENLWEVRKATGMVFQNPDNQIVATIVEDDVAFGVENLGIPSKEIRNRVDDALKWTSMYEFRENSPSQLSGGQKQRVAIAGILAMKPKLIVMDEPTAMLDPIGRREVMDAILRLNKDEKITVLLITHFMEEASLSDKIIVMESGNVVMEGTPREIFTQVEKLKSIGLDVPIATEIAYNLKKMGINISSEILTLDEMVGAICQLM